MGKKQETPAQISCHNKLPQAHTAAVSQTMRIKSDTKHACCVNATLSLVNLNAILNAIQNATAPTESFGKGTCMIHARLNGAVVTNDVAAENDKLESNFASNFEHSSCSELSQQK